MEESPVIVGDVMNATSALASQSTTSGVVLTETALRLVEGFFDCMRVHQAGFSCVVALMGARLSRAQKDLMANRFSSIVLLLDGDQAGRRATAQIASDLAPACSVTLLPPDTQPDQMAADQIRQVLTKAERRTAIRAN